MTNVKGHSTMWVLVIAKMGACDNTIKQSYFWAHSSQQKFHLDDLVPNNPFQTVILQSTMAKLCILSSFSLALQRLAKSCKSFFFVSSFKSVYVQSPLMHEYEKEVIQVKERNQTSMIKTFLKILCIFYDCRTCYHQGLNLKKFSSIITN